MHFKIDEMPYLDTPRKEQTLSFPPEEQKKLLKTKEFIVSDETSSTAQPIYRVDIITTWNRLTS